MHCTHLLKHFMDAIKMEYLEDGIYRSMSGVYMLFRCVLVVMSYLALSRIGWLLWELIFLSLSMLILIVQPYKKSYMNVLDGLLLVLMGFGTLFIVTFLYILPSTNESLRFIFVIACGLPQLVLMLSVAYRKLKGKHVRAS